MQPFILTGQIIISVVLITAILLQSQGSGLGSAWGGGGESYHTKRGVEKILLYVTIAGIFLFAVFSLASVIIK